MTTSNGTSFSDHIMSRPIRQRNARRFYGDSQESIVPRRVRIRNPRVIRNLNIVNDEPVINYDEQFIPLFNNDEISPCGNVAINLNVINIPVIMNNDNIQLDDINDDVIDDIVIPNADVLNIIADAEQMFHAIIQVDVILPVESINLRNDLELAASGIEPIVSLCNQPAMRSTMNTFVDGIFKNVLKHCIVCKENWFKELNDNDTYNECLRCTKEKKECVKKNIDFVGSMSSDNNMDPYFHSDNLAVAELLDLQKNYPLNSQEQALIAISTPIMSFFKLKGPRDGQNIGFKGNVINIAQDISKICKILPRLPSNCNIFTVRSRRGSDPSHYKDFKVRRERVHKWLLFLKKWNPAYRNIDICLVNLNALPLDNSVYENLHEVVVDNILNDAVHDNIHNADNVESDNDDDGIQDGPIDNELDDGILHTGIALEIQNINVANAIVADLLHPPLNNDIIEWPQLNPLPLDEYNTPYLLTNAFPCLFPFGNGDVTDKIRNIHVTLNDACNHYLKYGKLNTDAIMVHPFASDMKFCHYIQDMDERHRIQSQASIYLQKNPLDANLTVGALQEIARGYDNVSAFATEMRMRRYAGNILGSDQYMQLRKKELISLMCTKKIATVWFTLSLANHYWEDLQNIFCNPLHRLPDESDDKFKKREKKHAMQNYAHNPAIVNEMFVRRVKSFVKLFFGVNGLNSEWHWYRYEWQKRGNIHVHGLARLKSDPGLSKLSEDVAIGRKAQIILMMYKDIKMKLREIIPHIIRDIVFIDAPLDDDHLPETVTLLNMKFNDPLFQFTLLEIETLIETMNKGNESENQICVYRDYLLTSMNPSIPTDADKADRDENFIRPDIHPCSTCHLSNDGSHVLGGTNFNSTYNDMLQSCQRHKHTPNYCINKFGKCRFTFPRPLLDKTRVVMKDHPYKIGNNKGKLRKTTCEIIFKCNDRWLNSHCVIGFLGWGANIDMSILIDSRSVIEYVAKYCNKVEIGTNGLSKILTGVLRYGNEIGNVETKTLLRKCFNRLAGRRDKCSQETSHLILSSPIVVCSHTFIMINLSSLIRQVNLDDGDENAPALKPNLLDLYKVRLVKLSWNNPLVFDIIETTLHTLCFALFAEHYNLAKTGKITSRQGNQSKTVPIFSPDFKSIPNVQNYFKYCWFALLKYKPWINYCETVIDQDVPIDSCLNLSEVSDNLQISIITSWELFINNPDNHDQLNDSLMREIDKYQHNNDDNDDMGDLRSQNDLFSAADEQPEFNQIFRNITNNNLDDNEEVIQWQNEFNFHANINDYLFNENLIDSIISNHKNIVTLRTPMIRTPIFLNGLKSQQKNAVINFLHICGVMKDEYNQFLPKKYMPNSSIPNAMIITGTAGTGKSYTIDAMITELLVRLTEKGINGMEVLVLAPTGRAAMQAKGFTLHCAEGLSIPLIG